MIFIKKFNEARSLRTAIAIYITYEAASGDERILPKKKIGQKKFSDYFTKEVIKCDPFSHNGENIDKLYINTVTYQDYDLDYPPFPANYFYYNKPVWNIIIEIKDVKKWGVYRPYPYDRSIYPKAVADAFQKYLKN